VRLLWVYRVLESGEVGWLPTREEHNTMRSLKCSCLVVCALDDMLLILTDDGVKAIELDPKPWVMPTLIVCPFP
jgi:hypothetical protein